MRFVGRLLLLTLLLAALVMVGRLSRDRLLAFFKLAASDPRQEQAVEISSLYLLDDQRWTSFALPGGVELVRLVSNASLAEGTDLFAEEPVAYALHYQLLAGDGTLLAEQVYHQNSRVVPVANPETGEPELAAYFPDHPEMPAEGRIVLLNLRGLEGVAELRMRMGPHAPQVRGVGLRAYVLLKSAEHKLGFLWQRLSDRQRQSLAEGSVYPHELLLADEKRNLIRQAWRPVGPLGVVGKDYVQLQLYQRQGVDDARFDPPVLPAGLLVADGQYGVIPLPEGAHRVQLQLQPAGVATEPVRLRWFGSALEPPRHWEIPWPEREMWFDESFVGGLLEIESSAPLVVRSFVLEGEQRSEITPEVVYNRSYRLGPDHPLRYQVAHAGNVATPLRIDLRLALDSQRVAAGGTGTVSYRMLDQADRSVASGILEVPVQLSWYDRLVATADSERLTEPARYHFLLPMGVAKIQFEAAEPVLAAAYTRPPELVRELRVPEDYLARDDDRQRQPAWFGLRPVDHETLLQQNRSALLTLQQRPPEIQADLQAGRYQWEDFHPQGDWLGRQLLTPVETGQTLRREALTVTYRPLLVGRETVLDFRDLFNQPTVTPNFLYLRKDAAAEPFALFVDGRLHFRGLMVGRDGELPLPALVAGKHQLRIETAARGTFLVNSCSGPGPAFLKRLVNRLERGGLTFIVDHVAGEETLSARLFSPHGETRRSRLRVTLLDVSPAGFGPTVDWTFTRRRFDLSPVAGPVVPVLQSGGQQADTGQSFFIPLGRDLPAGGYRLQVELESGPGGYLLLSRLTPGLYSSRMLLRERDLVREAVDD